jgi:hypothetical protein
MSSDTPATAPPLQPFDVVTLLHDAPRHGLARSQVGAVVERFPDGGVEVEFNDRSGRPLARLSLRADQVMRLLYDLQQVV